MKLRRIFSIFAHDDRAQLEAFHRAEMREAGVTDDAFRAFLLGR